MLILRVVEEITNTLVETLVLADEGGLAVHATRIIEVKWSLVGNLDKI